MKKVNYAELNAKEAYEDLQYRALSSRIHKALQGRLSPSRKQVVKKLNRERKEHERR